VAAVVLQLEVVVVLVATVPLLLVKVLEVVRLRKPLSKLFRVRRTPLPSVVAVQGAHRMELMPHQGITVSSVHSRPMVVAVEVLVLIMRRLVAVRVAVSVVAHLGQLVLLEHRVRVLQDE